MFNIPNSASQELSFFAAGNDFRHWRKKIVKMEIILILAVILMIMRTKGRRANLSPPLGLKVTDSVFSSEALGFLNAVIFICTPFFAKPLLPPVADARRPPERRSSHSLLPSIQGRPSLRKATADKKSSKVSHEVSLPSQSSYGQAVVNGINVLCGVGILSTTCAVKEGGWVGLSILFIFAVVSYYTGILLHSCLDSQPGLETYPDIGHAAFGNVGRIATSVSLMPDPKARSYLCSLFVTAALICCVYFIGTAFLAKDDMADFVSPLSPLSRAVLQDFGSILLSATNISFEELQDLQHSHLDNLYCGILEER
ncbi:amino acid transporter AVT1C-like [Coffea arabica]|uniref:Amino acid transporter AVT1C-like n=1 Tax=Coffea arabica TaxID=13443 RepID=A0ABM4W8E3_COFAR|nr:amino acid transporter AVT1B-like [Coffea arabica]